MQAIATEPRLMPHLHLSLQAGSDMILKRMKRRHLRDDAIRLRGRGAAAAPRHDLWRRHHRGFSHRNRRDVRPVGRSGDRMRPDLSARLPFSPRKGTPAARMPQLRGAVVGERAAQLRAAGDAALARHLSFVSQTAS